MLNSAARVNASNGRESNGCGVKAKPISPAALAKNTIDRASVSRFFMVFKINWLRVNITKNPEPKKSGVKNFRQVIDNYSLWAE